MTADTTINPKTRTITMTDRPPVKIIEADWSVIAGGDCKEFDGEFESQATRTTTVWIRVRKHADGRHLVYGGYDYDSRWQGERNVTTRAGRLLAPGADVIDGIHEVAANLGADDDGARLIKSVTRECIASLPAELI